MTAEQAIKREVCLMVMDNKYASTPKQDIAEKNVDEVYSSIDDSEDSDTLHEMESEFRSSYTHETGIECDYSHHYESKSVACKLRDGRWVGWTYWYGGGKHGDPDAVGWMEDAYFLEAKEETKVVLVFSRVG